MFHFRREFSQFVPQQLFLFIAHHMGDATGSYQPTAETVTAKDLAEIQVFAPDSAKVGSWRVEGYIEAQCAKITNVVGNTFHFKGDGPHNGGALINFQVSQCFNGLCLTETVADGGIPGNGFSNDGQTLERYRLQQFFNTTMLIAKLDFQMENTLAAALKAEMARFDDSGVNWSNEIGRASCRERVLRLV